MVAKFDPNVRPKSAEDNFAFWHSERVEATSPQKDVLGKDFVTKQPDAELKQLKIEQQDSNG
jgi:hypothetical protein